MRHRGYFMNKQPSAPTRLNHYSSNCTVVISALGGQGKREEIKSTTIRTSSRVIEKNPAADNALCTLGRGQAGFYNYLFSTSNSETVDLSNLKTLAVLQAALASRKAQQAPTHTHTHTHTHTENHTTHTQTQTRCQHRCETTRSPAITRTRLE